jgi:hypothetical protein
MAPTIPATALVPTAPVFTNTERLALAGFLAGYSGLTRQAYELDLRQFTGWCHQHQLHLFQARRADIEFFARDLDSASSVDPGSMSIHRRASLCEASAATARTHPGGGHRYLANSRTSASRALRPALTCEAEG